MSQAESIRTVVSIRRRMIQQSEAFEAIPKCWMPAFAGHDVRWEVGSSRPYLIASGLTGEPTAPVIGIAGATNRYS